MIEPNPAAGPKSPAAIPSELTATMSHVQVSNDTSQTGVPTSAGSISTEPPLTTHFGRYRIEKELGKGAMGVVYLAEDSQLHRKVALKIPKRSLLENPQALERFYREARMTAALRHNNICQVYDVGAIDGMHYLTMAYISGKPISTFVSKEKFPATRQVALLIRKIALALEEAHQQGVVHRDLKPSNVMLDDRGEPIVMDFGLACQVNTEKNARLTQSGAILGTPAYMSPEQVRAELDQIGPQSDIYSLGVMLYQFLTGQLPFNGPVMVVLAQVLRDDPRLPEELRPDVDRRLAAVCMKMMAKDPAKRFASMKDVAQALTAYLKMRKPPGLEETMVPSAEMPEQRPEPLVDALSEFPEVEVNTQTFLKKKVQPVGKQLPVSARSRLRNEARFWPAAWRLAALPLIVLFAVVLVLRNGLMPHSPIADKTSADRKAKTDGQRRVTDDMSADLLAQRAVIDKLKAKGAQFEVMIDERIRPLSGNDSLPDDLKEFRVISVFSPQGAQVSAADLDDLQVFPSLESLGLYNVEFTAEMLDRLAEQRPRLKSLGINKTPIKSQEFASVAKFTELRSLSIWESPNLTGKGLQALAPLSRLTELTLTNAQLTDDDLQQLPAWPQLTSLSIGQARINGRGGNELPRKCPMLSKLDLYGSMLDGKQIAWLGQLPLEELKISLGTIHDMRLDQLSPLPRLKKLMFNVSGRYGQQNKVIPQYLEFRPTEIAWLQSCSELRELEVWALSNQQVSQLAEVRNLQKLIISYTVDLQPQTAESLRSLPNLEHLYFLFCNVDDDFAPVVAKFDRLAGLMLMGTKLTPSGMKLIRAGLPNCQISTDVRE